MIVAQDLSRAAILSPLSLDCPLSVSTHRAASLHVAHVNLGTVSGGEAMRAPLPPIFGRFSRSVFFVLVGQMSPVASGFDGEKPAAKGAKTRSNRIEIVGLPARATRDMDARRHIENEVHESLKRIATTLREIGDDLRAGCDVLEVAGEDA